MSLLHRCIFLFWKFSYREQQMLPEPCCAVQHHSPGREQDADAHLNFNVPAVYDLYDAHHIIEHQT